MIDGYGLKTFLEENLVLNTSPIDVQKSLHQKPKFRELQLHRANTIHRP